MHSCLSSAVFCYKAWRVSNWIVITENCQVVKNIFIIKRMYRKTLKLLPMFTYVKNCKTIYQIITQYIILEIIWVSFTKILTTIDNLKLNNQDCFKTLEMIVLQCICIIIRFPVINCFLFLFLEWFYIRLYNKHETMIDPTNWMVCLA